MHSGYSAGSSKRPRVIRAPIAAVGLASLVLLGASMCDGFADVFMRSWSQLERSQWRASLPKTLWVVVDDEFGSGALGARVVGVAPELGLEVSRDSDVRLSRVMDGPSVSSVRLLGFVLASTVVAGGESATTFVEYSMTGRRERMGAYTWLEGTRD